MTKIWEHCYPNVNLVVHIIVPWFGKWVISIFSWSRYIHLWPGANVSEIGHNDFTMETQNDCHMRVIIWWNKALLVMNALLVTVITLTICDDCDLIVIDCLQLNSINSVYLDRKKLLLLLFFHNSDRYEVQSPGN